jgi:hypothetical protein
MAYPNVRKRMLTRDLVTENVDTHHWAIHQVSNAPDWMKNHVANLMPNISDDAHYLAHHGNLAQRFWHGTPGWAKAAGAGVASYATGLFVNSPCGCRN